MRPNDGARPYRNPSLIGTWPDDGDVATAPVRVRRAGAGDQWRDHEAPPPEAPSDACDQLQHGA